MSVRLLTLVLRSSAVIGASISAASVAWIASNGWGPVLLSEGGALSLFSVFFAVIAWLVSPRQPRNRLVWIMASTSLFGSLYLAGWVGAAVLVGDQSIFQGELIPAQLPEAAAWLLLTTLPFGSAAFIVLMTFGLLMFPDGNLPSPRWRWAGFLAAAAVCLLILAFGWSLRPGSTAGLSGPLVDAGSVALALAMIVSLVALAGRFRRSVGSVRKQFKWVAWGASVLTLSFIFTVLLAGTSLEDLGLAAFALAGVVFVASYGIALGKYQLFDIDIVISRTFVYVTLAVFITGVYVAAVVGIGGLLHLDPDSSPWLAIGATALVAFAFEPLRESLQRVANRLVYGRRSTPYEVLSEFAHKIAATDEELLDQVARSLAEGTTAKEATVWMLRGKTLHPVATWPPGNIALPIDDFDESSNIPRAQLTKPVIHDGEHLGSLSLSTARGQTLLESDEQLLSELASAMGLALRNMRLSEDLREKVQHLERSRQRLLTVQDETRRHLERQLHDGAQQRLVALKVKLALLAKRPEASAEERLRDLLVRISKDTDRAIGSLRDFARGVYPPLLEAEGPAKALASQVDKLPLPVTIHAAGLGRYSRSVEATIYFCVLEALQNVVKHAKALSAHVVVRTSNGSLMFEVSDDGRGFDPGAVREGSGLSNLRDRIDAMDGEFEIRSAERRGTRVRGIIPVIESEVAV